ncbi:MAG: SafA/ExsA family spore coat assembly protein [Oscillospiraceae bacterium]|nr:SafA/ExsA family spore coat assembly protein [Oscillospiraceae bacterium]
MKKLLRMALSALLIVQVLVTHVSAATTHTVVSGESMWKIATKYQVGLSEIKTANPQIINYDLIYPGQVINIPTIDSTVTSYEQEVIRLVNEIRAENGLKVLTYDWELARVARYKSQDMKDDKYFSHTSPVYGTPFQMIKNFGISYRSAGENIAKGYATPQAVVNGWMNSSGHRANILNANYTHIGVGYVSGGNYWTQMFISY